MTTAATDIKGVLGSRISDEDLAKLLAIDNPDMHTFVLDGARLCEPDEVRVFDDSDEGLADTRRTAIGKREEAKLALDGHTIHYDGPNDQGRDREVTRYLVPEDDALSKALNQIERETGLNEVRGIMKGSMKGKIMIVRFLSLGPTGSVFSIPCVECTDSWYVSHSLNLLYRCGYEQFKRNPPDTEFFAILHSAGVLNERMVSADVPNRRIYIDYTRNTVYSVNTQYAGNTVGLKKLALRLTIRKADREDWLCEHMFLAGIHGAGGRKTYFAGAFPSACGKTSTAMLPGETILGDDIAYFRAIDGECRAVNAESGIFGIIQNVKEKDDPAIWEVLNKPGEVIFSNVLTKDGKPYWLGMGVETPASGVTWVGDWYAGMKGEDGKDVPLAHKNARYTVQLKALANCDPELDNPDGVVLQGILYGGRDPRGYVPCQQSFDWDHGIVAYGASLETETTFATIGQEGVPEINLMSIQDFVAISLGKYVQNNLNFGKKLREPPLIFGVNYFLCNLRTGEFLNGVRDKHVWVKWMEKRVHGEIGARRGPTGWLPKYEDLVPLFKQVLGKDYAEPDYVAQFTIRVPENIAKMDRVAEFHRQHVPNAPAVVQEILAQQRERLVQLRDEHGDYVSPLRLPVESA
ncbi:MAG: phosphoenolpyruvate carboxykinase (GTP) [Kiritimatiellae bacterium]|nr:phosphoenolpyruvate carboxykinase (GTP) [Kiritimatiellia bacterium]